MNSVPIHLDGPRAYVPMVVGIMPITVVIDTGCDDMTVNETVASRLIASNQATSLPDDKIEYADGSIKDEKAITINTVTIAGRQLHNVHANVVPDNTDMLLGFSILSQVSGKFAIDTTNSKLVFE
jgi:clan AA aspartic protease (TIGR02281 family)